MWRYVKYKLCAAIPVGAMKCNLDEVILATSADS